MVDHGNYLKWRHCPPRTPSSRESAAAGHIRVSFADLLCPSAIQMTKGPSVKSVKLTVLTNVATGYGASLFIPALSRFIAQFNHPTSTRAQIEEVSHNVVLPFRSVPVFHRIKFVNSDFFGRDILDSIHVYPRLVRNGRVTRISRFDTALILVREAGEDSDKWDGKLNFVYY